MSCYRALAGIYLGEVGREKDGQEDFLSLCSVIGNVMHVINNTAKL